MLSIANIYYEYSTRLRKDAAQQQDWLKRSMDKYIHVLENDESNVFASIGIANVLAEHNKVIESVEILKAVKEACPTHIQLPNVLINLAHLNIVLDNYEAAINLYKKAIEMCVHSGSGNLDNELYLAKAYYLSRSYDQCSKILKGLASRYPSDLRVKFDLAMCLFDHANESFNKEVRPVKETEKAIAQLNHANKLMDFIRTQRDSLPFLHSNPS